MIPNRGPATSAVTIIMIVLCTVFVAARFYTRVFLVRSIKQDDWWILAAWIVAVGFSASICVGVHYGLGHHTANIAAAQFPSLRKADYTFSVLYNPSLMLTKTSIVIFYLSVMSKDVDPVFKWCNWLTLAVVNIAGLALTFLSLFQCRPVSAGFLYPTPANANCTDIVTLYLSSAPVNIITDLAILFLPMPILTRMRLPKKQKIILVATFSFGAFVAVVDVVRIAYLQNAALHRLTNVGTGSNPRITEQDDFPWFASLSFMWSAVEVNLGIICACVPSLKPLFIKFLPNLVRDVGDQTVTGSLVSIEDISMAAPDTATRNMSIVTNPARFRKPSVKEYAGEDSGDEMGFLNMLAGPDDDAPNGSRPVSRTSRLTRVSTSKSVSSDFGFVTMDNNKNMLKLSNSQSVWPIAVVTIIFFLWGFAYGLLDTLNAQFQKDVSLSQGESLGLHAAYYAGYLVGPLSLGRFILKRYGFKASMMAGLCVYGCGTLVFWPSAVLTSYIAFVISNFIVAFGLSCLEIAANPYIALCGPLEYAEVRLNLSQGFQAIGTVLSLLLANKVLFRSVSGSSLIDVQWAYLGIALFVFALAVVFYYTPLPEATDDQLEELADRHSANNRARVNVGFGRSFQVVWVTLAFGVFSQWCYVGGQESIGSNTGVLVGALTLPNKRLTVFDYGTLGHTVFAIGRFLSAFANYIIKPRYILLFLYIGLVVTCGLQMTLSSTASVSIDMLIYFFEAGTFSIIFAISMRGMGAHTKTASAFMTAAISGGAIPPVIQWAVAKGHGIRYSYCVPMAVFAFGFLFPVYLNLVRKARLQVDPVHEDRSQRRAVRRLRRASTAEVAAPEVREFGLAGIIARRRRQKAREAAGGDEEDQQQQQQVGTAQHIEGRHERRSSGLSSSSPPSPISGALSPVDVEKFDFPEDPRASPVAMKGPATTATTNNVVGDLAPWGGSGGDSGLGKSVGGGGSSDDNNSDEIRPHVDVHRPPLEKDSLDDLYHAALRGR